MADARGIGLAEEQKNRLANAMAVAAGEFLTADTELMRSVVQITGALAKYVQEHPAVFETGSDPKDIDAILDALRSRGVGGDVSGGASVSLQDIADFIKNISGLVDSEKQFFLQIIKLIFCGC